MWGAAGAPRIRVLEADPPWRPRNAESTREEPLLPALFTDVPTLARIKTA
jgi:hypothetical protein